MSTKYDSVAVSVDWHADFVGYRTLKFEFPVTEEDAELVRLLVARYQRLQEEALAQAHGESAPIELGIG